MFSSFVPLFISRQDPQPIALPACLQQGDGSQDREARHKVGLPMVQLISEFIVCSSKRSPRSSLPKLFSFSCSGECSLIQMDPFPSSPVGHMSLQKDTCNTCHITEEDTCRIQAGRSSLRKTRSAEHLSCPKIVVSKVIFQIFMYDIFINKMPMSILASSEEKETVTFSVARPAWPR